MEVTIKKPKVRAKNQNGALSIRQIRNRVGDGWAIIKNPEYNGAILLKGELIYHSSDRFAALEEMGKCRNGDFAFKFCGKRDPNVAYIL
ncbi:MAG: hypothetical protein FWH18_05285 [Marinilabiliaceae bacterium]|nr:hypothetical protein [Marinilabiliaceae bacterium]